MTGSSAPAATSQLVTQGFKTVSSSQDNGDSQGSSDSCDPCSHVACDSHREADRGHDNGDSQITTDSSQSSHASQRRTDGELEAIVIQATCGQCWAYPNRPCKLDGTTGLHFARYARAHVKGVITAEELDVANSHVGERNYVIWPVTQ
jgi:hypothetical protein